MLGGFPSTVEFVYYFVVKGLCRYGESTCHARTGCGAGWRPMSQTLPVKSSGGVRLRRSTFDSALGTGEKENLLRRVSGEGNWQCDLRTLGPARHREQLTDFSGGDGDCSSGEGVGTKIDRPTDTCQCIDEPPYCCIGIAIAELGTTWRWKGRLAAIGRKWYFSRTRRHIMNIKDIGRVGRAVWFRI